MQWIWEKRTAKGRSGGDGTLALQGRPHLMQLPGLSAWTRP